MKKLTCAITVAAFMCVNWYSVAAAPEVNTNNLTTNNTALQSGRSDSFNSGWRFNLGDIAGAEGKNFDDSGWRPLSLPHDWAIEGDFSEDNPSGAGGGALPGGTGWYRKNFTIPDNAKGKQIYIDFDGVYMNSSVYINRHYAGGRPYGYASFSIDATPWLKPGEENTIA